MKKFALFILLSAMFTMLFSVASYAGTVIDTSNISKGIVTVKSDDIAGKTIKAQVEKGSEKYVYTLIKSPTNLPLQMGTGDYKISVLENVAGDKYKALVSETVKVAAIDEKEMYKASIPIVEYSVSTKAIPAYKTVASGKDAEIDKINAVYDSIITEYSYDNDKAASVSPGYVPVIDDVYASKKGICYDYAAMLGGSLRSIGVPTRLVMGYVPEISQYHAWNEVLISGNWVAVDSTYDSQMVKAGLESKLEKDKTKTKVIKIY